MPNKNKSPKSTTRTPNKLLRLHGSIARDLGVSIVSGDFATGDLLHNEIEASERLKVSRTAYREAIRILAAKGLVHSRPKVGTRVSAPESWHLLDPDVLSWIFESDPNESLLANLFELRGIVEPEAAALAASRRTRGHLDSMRHALQGMAEHSLTTEAGRLADREFHSALLRSSGNAFLASLTSGIAAAITWTTVFKQRKNRLSRDPMPDHQRVFDAIEAGNPAAARKAMRALIGLAFVETKSPRGPKKRAQ
jgi:DNA-binding FadR family transcriptional regulator